MTTIIKRNEKGYYTIDGELYVSSTTVLQVIDKPFLRFWYGAKGTEECNRVMEEASEIGTGTHQMIEDYTNGRDVITLDILTFNDPIDTAFSAFVQWTEDNDIIFLMTEKIVYSHKYKFAGTMDLLAIVNGVLCLIDFKTSKRFSQENVLQEEAYRVALTEMGYQKPEQLMVLRLDKERGRYYEHWFKPSNEMFKLFLSAKDLWHWRND